MASDSDSEDEYKYKTDVEHVLDCAGMYVGSIEKMDLDCYIVNGRTKKMYKADLSICQALMKIFDEILVNAYDRTVLDIEPPTTEIIIEIDEDTSSIKIQNNGKSIDIRKHKKFKDIYIPQFIFTKLRTSTNYDKKKEGKKHYTGGRYGVGASITNIFSKKFMVKICNEEYQKKYVQVYSNNLKTINEPKITDYDEEGSYTQIRFIPDLRRFGMKKLDKDIIKLMYRRCYDLCMCANNNLSTNKVNVHLNGKLLKYNKFENYFKMYIDNDYFVVQTSNKFWKLGICLTEKNDIIAFVNGISCNKGTHVSYITNQIVEGVTKRFKKEKEFKNVNIKKQYILGNLFICINQIVNDPEFDSQSKTKQITNQNKFEKYKIPPGMITKLLDFGLYDIIRSKISAAENKQLFKALNTNKHNIKSIPNLIDANWAGKKGKSQHTTLIVAEGKSAITLAKAGISAVEKPYKGNDIYGTFPLKGKLLDVRNASNDQIANNKEIQNILKIVGIKPGTKYTKENIKTKLRYNSILIFTDADVDGLHISSLFINFISFVCPELLEIDGFLQDFRTPVIKIKKKGKGTKKKCKIFLCIKEYEEWLETADLSLWHKPKYYKGLGTSTPAEGKEYFSNIDDYKRSFKFDDKTNDMINLAFSKSAGKINTDRRKKWLLGIDNNYYPDYSIKELPISRFIDKELITFSQYDNIRSIPNVLDGLKPSQRKILYTAKKMKLNNEIKVAQFSGYISASTAYHHGEASLQNAIIGMAQDFIGANNINLLEPRGQFGSRDEGGKDHASARYIFTMLNPLTNVIFNPLDDPLLDYLKDDNDPIEPRFYIPIVPTILINGCEGIGTGWSTGIPLYNPHDIVKNIMLKLDDKKMMQMKPWYRGFKGEVWKKDNYFVSVGNYKLNTSKRILEIVELPVGSWTSKYKHFIDTLIEPVKKKDIKSNKNYCVKSYKMYNDDVTVRFVIELAKSFKLSNKNINETICNTFKLTSKISISNMHAWDSNNKIKKYKSPLQIINEFYDVRLVYYDKRKQYYLNSIKNDITKLTEKIRFIIMAIKDKINKSTLREFNIDNEIDEIEPFDLRFKKKKVIHEELQKRNFELMNDSYDYLLNMRIHSFTTDKIIELLKQRDDKNTDYNILYNKTNKDLWKEDLESFLEILGKN